MGLFKNFKDDRLLPCPFCGEDAEIGWIKTSSGVDKYYVGCSNEKCGCELVGTGPSYDLDKLIDLWNTRKLVKENGQWILY